MTVEPSEQGKSGAHKAPRAWLAGDVLEGDGATGLESGGTSPLRVLLVIVPLLIIIVASTNLVGLWSTPFQERSRQPEHSPPDDEAVGWPRRTDETSESPPATPGAGFDASVVLALLPGANAEDGARIFRMCAACHAAEKDAPHRLATTLWGIVGRRKASHPDFNYSATLRAIGGTWSYRELAEYIHDPRKFAPGTSMTFVGIADNGRMASLLAYLRTLSDDPAPLPR